MFRDIIYLYIIYCPVSYLLNQSLIIIVTYVKYRIYIALVHFF